MSHTVQKRADEGHAPDFHFRDEAVRHAQPQHKRQNVEITGVIRRINFCTRRFHVLFADDAHAAADEREQNFESGRGEASGFPVILDELHHHPRGNNPKEKHHTEVHTVQNLEPALHPGKDFAADVAQRAPCSQAHDLYPGWRARGGKSSRQIELLGFFAAQFTAGRFWDAARRN